MKKWDKFWALELRYCEAMRTDGQKHPTAMTLHIVGVAPLLMEAIKAGVSMEKLRNLFATWSRDWELDQQARSAFDTALEARKG